MFRTLAPLARASACAFLAASLAGCALLFVSTDGLSDGTAPNEAGGAEATTDAPQEDGGLPGSDASIDGAGDADGAESSSRFCTQNPGHGFCDDFDDRSDVKQGWDLSVGGRGVVDSDVMVFRSAPRSFASRTPAGAPQISYAALQHDFAETTRIKVAFDVLVTLPTGNAGDSMATVAFPNGYIDIVWFSDGHLTMTERTSDPNVEHAVTRKILPGAWARLEVVLTPGHLAATIDGITAIDTATTHTFSGGSSISVGLYSNDALAISMNYDNLTVDTAF